MKYSEKRKHGAVRDAIVEALAYRPGGATVAEITREVSVRIGVTPASSIRSYLRLNTPKLFVQAERGHYRVREEAQATLAFPNGVVSLSERQNQKAAPEGARQAFRFGNATLIHDDCFRWLANAPTNSIEAVVTDPPYGLVEYSEEEQATAAAVYGGFLRRLMATNARRCRVLPSYRVKTSRN